MWMPTQHPFTKILVALGERGGEGEKYKLSRYTLRGMGEEWNGEKERRLQEGGRRSLDSLCDGGRHKLFQVLHAPLLQELEDGTGLATDTDVRHKSQILHQTHSMALTQQRGGKKKYYFPTLHLHITSGVSAGHIMPQCVLWSCRGLASFPSRPIGELSLRR